VSKENSLGDTYSTITVSLNISEDEYVKMYHGKGRAYSVFAKTTDGKSIRFPANILQPFVTRSGVRGTFLIHCDENNRFVNIQKIA
jgi:DNA gyrase/topoisomerase IV subunit A